MNKSIEHNFVNFWAQKEARVFLILMKFELSTSTWFQVVPFCSQISEHFFVGPLLPMSVIFIGPRYTWGPIYGSESL